MGKTAKANSEIGCPASFFLMLRRWRHKPYWNIHTLLGSYEETSLALLFPVIISMAFLTGDI